MSRDLAMGTLRDGKFAPVLSVQDPQHWPSKQVICSTKNFILIGDYLYNSPPHPHPPPYKTELNINAT